MTSVLHLFLQSLSAVIFLVFILQLAFISQSTMYLSTIGWVQSFEPVQMILTVNKLICFLLLFVISILYIIKTVLMKPAYLQMVTTMVYFALGMALLGFTKLTIGEHNPYTLGFLRKHESLVGEDSTLPFNPIKIKDYSTQYSCPNGPFYFLILLINLIAVRSFSKTKKTGDLIETKLPSRTELNESEVVRTTRKRRKSIEINDLVQKRRKSIDNLDDLENDLNQGLTSNQPSFRNNEITPQKKFDLFEKEFSVQSADNISQADSDTTNVKSSSSLVFLEKFEQLKRKSAITIVLLKLKDNVLNIQKSEPKPVLFWMMTYQNFKSLSNLIMVFVGATLYLSGNAFLTDIIFAIVFAKSFSRFYFRVLER